MKRATASVRSKTEPLTRDELVPGRGSVVEDRSRSTAHNEAGWIPASEERPDDERVVVVLDEAERAFFGYYGKLGGKRRWFYDDGTRAKVMCWVDLPVTPSGKKLQQAGLDVENQYESCEEVRRRFSE